MVDMKNKNNGGVMRKIMLGILMALFVGGIAFASVNVLSDGSNLGPTQDINFTGGTITNGGPTKTVALGTATVTSGTINGATIGATTPSTGVFTTVNATTSVNWQDATVFSQRAAVNWTDVTVDFTAITAQGINWGNSGFLCIDATGKLSTQPTSCP